MGRSLAGLELLSLESRPSEQMRRALLCLMLLLAVAGCSWRSDREVEVATEPAGNLDCLYPIVWDDRWYEPAVELPRGWEAREELGPGVVLGCGSPEMGYYPDEGVEVKSIEGIHSSIAVAALMDGSSRSTIWAAPGYLIESPRHPLHEALADNWGYDDQSWYACEEETLRTRGRSLTTPRLGQGLEVVAVNPAVEELLVAPGGNRWVAVNPETELTGFDRNGVPYVGEGDDFVLQAKLCRDVDDPVPDGPFLVAVSVRKL
jgi:hypothetical protein